MTVVRIPDSIIHMQSSITNSLTEYGLSQRESEVYVYLLKKIESSVFEISKHTKIPRTTVYATLENLHRLGFVSTFQKNGVLHYTPTNPNRLQQALDKKMAALQEILPELHGLIGNTAIKPKIELYTGTEGIKTLLEDILLTCKKNNIREIYAAAHPELLDALPKYFPGWVARRAAMKVYAHLIIPDSMRHRQEYYSGYFRETRFLPQNFPFQCSVDIYGNKLGFFSFKDGEIYSVIIESPTISDMFKQFFLFTWEMLGKQNLRQ